MIDSKSVETHGCASPSRERATIFFDLNFKELIDLSSLGDAQPWVSTERNIEK